MSETSAQPFTDTQAIIDVAQEAVGSEALVLGEYHVVVTRHGVTHVDLTGDQWRDRAGLSPLRKTGTVTVRDAPSFLVYWAKHSSPDAEVFANRDAGTVIGVLDAHGPYDADPQWQDHRVALALRHSEAFQAWKGISGRMMSQTVFAEFIEDHRADIINPDAAAVLEMAQTIQATTKVNFKSSQLLKSGQRQLSYVEAIDATAGQRGELAIPDRLDLALQVYDGAPVADQVAARLRYRIDGDGRLGLGVILDQLDQVVQAAFEGVIEQVQAGVPSPVLRGSPAT